MDLNRSIIRSEVRQTLEEYLQSNTNRSANAGETGRLEGSCKLILLCTSLLVLSLLYPHIQLFHGYSFEVAGYSAVTPLSVTF